MFNLTIVMLLNPKSYKMKALKYKYFVCWFCFTRLDQIVCIGRCLNGIEMEEFSLRQTKDSLMLKLMRNKVLYDLPVVPAMLPCILHIIFSKNQSLFEYLLFTLPQYC